MKNNASVWIWERELKRTRKNKPVKSYAVQWRDPKTGKVKTEAVGTDSARARDRMGQIRQALNEGTFRTIARKSWDEFVREHLATLADLAEATREEEARALKKFESICHPLSVNVVDYSMLELYANNRLESGVSPATCNKELRHIRKALNRAVKRGYLAECPFKAGGLFKSENQPEPAFVKPEDFALMLAACTCDRWRAIITLGYYCGMRRGEIAALEWKDVDFEAGILTVRSRESHRTKSRKDRKIPMAAEVVEALGKLRPGQFKSPSVFLSPLTGDQIQNNLNRDYNVILKRAGLVDEQKDPKTGKVKKTPRYTIHDLRRSFITRLFGAGVDPRTVQDLAGHYDIDTTMRFYAAVLDERKREAVNRLSHFPALNVLPTQGQIQGISEDQKKTQAV